MGVNVGVNYRSVPKESKKIKKKERKRQREGDLTHTRIRKYPASKYLHTYTTPPPLFLSISSHKKNTYSHAHTHSLRQTTHF